MWTGVQLDLRLVSSSAAPENIHTLHGRDWNFLGMRSGVPQEKNLMKSMKLNWKMIVPSWCRVIRLRWPNTVLARCFADGN